MKRKKIILAGLALIVLVSGGIALWVKYRYPYGRYHICHTQIILALKIYANDHGGAYPAGEESPEASLSLLYRESILKAPVLLAGKAGDPGVAKKILEAGKLLGPESCNWHYVEGLCENDPATVAVLWDKVPGLGHNCERMADDGREVVFLGGQGRYIPGTNWPAFLAEQKQIVSRIKEQRMKGN